MQVNCMAEVMYHAYSYQHNYDQRQNLQLMHSMHAFDTFFSLLLWTLSIIVMSHTWYIYL